MPYRLPDGTVIARPSAIRSFVLDGIQHNEACLVKWDNQGTLGDYGIVKFSAPTPPPPTAEELAERARVGRQDQRVDRLREAVVDQMEMIVELFKVGRDKGIWKGSDFPGRLVTKANEWMDLISQYRDDEV